MALEPVSFLPDAGELHGERRRSGGEDGIGR